MVSEHFEVELTSSSIRFVGIIADLIAGVTPLGDSTMSIAVDEELRLFSDRVGLDADDAGLAASGDKDETGDLLFS